MNELKAGRWQSGGNGDSLGDRWYQGGMEEDPQPPGAPRKARRLAVTDPQEYLTWNNDVKQWCCVNYTSRAGKKLSISADPCVWSSSLWGLHESKHIDANRDRQGQPTGSAVATTRTPNSVTAEWQTRRKLWGGAVRIREFWKDLAETYNTEFS